MKTVGRILEGPGIRSVEDVHNLRLMALLKDMVRELGPVEAAEALGIDRKTVTLRAPSSVVGNSGGLLALWVIETALGPVSNWPPRILPA